MEPQPTFSEQRSGSLEPQGAPFSRLLCHGLLLLLTACVVASPLLIPPLAGNAVVGGPVAGDLVNFLFIFMTLALFWMRRLPVRVPLGATYLLFVLGGVLALPQAVEPSGSAQVLAQDVYLFCWFFALTNVLRMDTGSVARRISTYWIFTALAIALVAFISFVAYPDLVLNLLGWPTVNPEGRVMATFRDPNLAGHYLVISFFVLWAAPKPKPLIKALLSVPLLLAVAVTYSNTALTALLGGLIVAGAVALLAPRPRLTPVVLGLAGTSLALVIWLAPTLIGTLKATNTSFANPTFLSGSVGRIDNSARYRVERWRTAMDLFGDRAIIGIAPGSAYTASHLLHTPVTGELHNDYVAALIERGLLGGIGILGLMAAATGYSLRANRRDRLRAAGWHPVFLVGGVIAVAVSAMTLEVMHFRHVWLFLALVAALGTADDPSVPAGLRRA
jgi:O-Antigen ligase